MQGDEVYFGSRSFTPSLKVSFHKSGKWHIISKWGDTSTRNPLPVVNYRWPRPQFDRFGFAHGIVVVVDPFPLDYPFKNKAILDPSVKWIPLPQFGNLIILRVLIARKNTDLDASRFLPRDRVMGQMPKENGEKVLLLAHDTKLTAVISQKIIRYRSEIQLHYRKEDFDKVDLLDITRAQSIDTPNSRDRSPEIYDLSLGYENVVFD